jgi:hypothetical protein
MIAMVMMMIMVLERLLRKLHEELSTSTRGKKQDVLIDAGNWW